MGGELPIDSSDVEDHGRREGLAYNYSIYLMAGMPFLVMAGFGLLIYREVRVARKQLPPEQQDPSID